MKNKIQLETSKVSAVDRTLLPSVTPKRIGSISPTVRGNSSKNTIKKYEPVFSDEGDLIKISKYE